MSFLSDWREPRNEGKDIKVVFNNAFAPGLAHGVLCRLLIDSLRFMG
jgi:hypothetical protein